jgi:hypothetical protein
MIPLRGGHIVIANDSSRSYRRRTVVVLLWAVASILAAEVVLLSLNWPFTARRLAESLGRSTGSRIHIGNLHTMYFPHPGCIAENVTVERGADIVLAKAERMVVRSSWTALVTFRKRVELFRIEGLNVRIPDDVPPALPSDGQQKAPATIVELLAPGATLAVGNIPVTFEISNLALHNVNKSEPMLLDIRLRSSHAPGLIAFNGSFGRWKGEATPLAGRFTMTDADLSRYSGIAGLLHGAGEVKGVLSNLQVHGQADAAGFQVNQSPNRVDLKTKFEAVVNGMKGDVKLTQVNAEFLETVLIASGTIAGEHGKTVAIDFDSSRARVQDLLTMFTKNPNPALTGPISLRAHTELPPGPGKFLEKLRIDGHFGIQQAEFTRAITQSKMNELSARARIGDHAGKKKDDITPPASVVSEIKSAVRLRNGTANLSDLSITVPGARAMGAGIYDLLTKQINLHGTLTMASTLSEASGGGWKSAFLKPVNFLFKKNYAGAVVSVSMTGTYPHPQLRVSLKKP